MNYIYCVDKTQQKIRGGVELESRFDYSLLRQRMKAYRFSVSQLASKAGMDRSSLSLRLNNRREFTQEDILKISNVLEINHDDLGAYFFKDCVEKTKQND